VRITRINATPLLGDTPQTGWSRGNTRFENLYTLLEVETDEHIVGLGSCFTSTALVKASLEILEPLLEGENPLEPDHVCEKLHQASYWYGRGGAITTTIGGLDIALWDILGKVTGQPVGLLLGGIYRDRVPVYASILFADPPLLRDRLLELVGRGFRAIKMGWTGFGRISRQHDERLIKTAREAVGPNTELFVDAGGAEEFWPHRYKWALETSRMLNEYEIGWFEEPLPYDDLDSYILLREHSPVPIAAGEALTRRQSFQPFIERRALDIVQPDTTKVGGLSEARRIAWAAYDHGIDYVSHGWNTAVGVSADLHLAAAIPGARFVEFQTGSPYIDGISKTDFRLDGDGCLAIPNGPGLGIELDFERIRQRSLPE
jgi:D-galactarolactone cycloisomerase